MNALVERLGRRWRTAAAFSSIAYGWADRPALFLSGLAREIPFSGSGLYGRLGRFLGQEVRPRVKAAGGNRICLDLRDATDLMILQEIFIDGVYPLEILPFEPDAVVDCGACAGFFTLLAYARFPHARLFAFEPELRNLKRLRRNISLNEVEVYPAAVGLEDRTARFRGEGFGGHLASAPGPDAVDVRMVDFRRFLESCGAKRLLLKMDIEGAEAELLPAIAGLMPHATALYLETHHPESVCRSYMQPLLDEGFSHREIRRRHDVATQTDYVERILLRE